MSEMYVKTSKNLNKSHESNKEEKHEEIKQIHNSVEQLSPEEQCNMINNLSEADIAII